SLTGAYGAGGTSYGMVSANLRKYIKFRTMLNLPCYW
ncbi:MAG: hypothetical protein K0Q50_3041, partial [Vampirovibrio sp.]|nr:hypothetical protein [Vampirovibrio sp.]